MTDLNAVTVPLYSFGQLSATGYRIGSGYHVKLNWGMTELAKAPSLIACIEYAYVGVRLRHPKYHAWIDNANRDGILHALEEMVNLIMPKHLNSTNEGLVKSLTKVGVTWLVEQNEILRLNIGPEMSDVEAMKAIDQARDAFFAANSKRKDFVVNVKLSSDFKGPYHDDLLDVSISEQSANKSNYLSVGEGNIHNSCFNAQWVKDAKNKLTTAVSGSNITIDGNSIKVVCPGEVAFTAPQVEMSSNMDDIEAYYYTDPKFDTAGKRIDFRTFAEQHLGWDVTKVPLIDFLHCNRYFTLPDYENRFMGFLDKVNEADVQRKKKVILQSILSMDFARKAETSDLKEGVVPVPLIDTGRPAVIKDADTAYKHAEVGSTNNLTGLMVNSSTPETGYRSMIQEVLSTLKTTQEQLSAIPADMRNFYESNPIWLNESEMKPIEDYLRENLHWDFENETVAKLLSDLHNRLSFEKGSHEHQFIEYLKKLNKK